MHAPPPGWKRARSGKLWMQRAGFTVCLFPPSGWRIGVYGPKGTTPEYHDVLEAHTGLREDEAAGLALELVARELGTDEADR